MLRSTTGCTIVLILMVIRITSRACNLGCVQSPLLLISGSKVSLRTSNSEEFLDAAVGAPQL